MREYFRANEEILFYYFIKQAATQTDAFLKWYNQLDSDIQNTIDSFQKKLQITMPYWSQIAFFTKLRTSFFKEELTGLLNRNSLLREFLRENIHHLRIALENWHNFHHKESNNNSLFISANKPSNSKFMLSGKSNKSLHRVKSFTDLPILAEQETKSYSKMS